MGLDGREGLFYFLKKRVLAGRLSQIKGAVGLAKRLDKLAIMHQGVYFRKSKEIPLSSPSVSERYKIR